VRGSEFVGWVKRRFAAQSHSLIHFAKHLKMFRMIQGSRSEWDWLLDDLRECGVVVEAGLSEAETREVESRFDIRFPPDLRALLQTGLPVDGPFPDWRDGDEGKLRSRLAWPLDGMKFDVENNSFWFPEWGKRPTSLEESFSIAARAVAAAPRLIPVFAHRYIPAEPPKSGNPVFSVYQTDIIIYGNDLMSYFSREFKGVAKWHTPPLDPRDIPFWSRLTFGDFTPQE
jgi:hypothetical protein